jgi:signal peptidase I
VEPGNTGTGLASGVYRTHKGHAKGWNSGDDDVSEAETKEGTVEGRTEGTAGRRPRLLATMSDWTKSLLVAFAIFLVVRAFVVEAFKIPTSSMENTLLVGDFLLVGKSMSDPDRGDVVVFHPPHEPARNYVKRVVGLPNDTLEMRGKDLYLNGLLMPEPYARHVDDRGDRVHPDMDWQSNHLIAAPPDEYHPTRDNWGPLVVPEGHYFMLGDNRDNSEDSRYWGFVARDQLRGRPWIVYYSQEPFGAGRTA